MANEYNADANLILNNKCNELIDCYREIRANLLSTLKTDNSKCFFVATNSEIEKGALTATNLATIISMLNKKVVLVDANLHDFEIARKYISQNVKQGLSDFLNSTIKKEEIIQKVNDNLSVIFSGEATPNASEVLASEKMSALINSLKEEFDYVVLNSSPLDLFPDVYSLVNVCDGAVISTKKMKSNIKKLKKLVTSLGKLQTKVYGFIYQE